MKECQTKRRNVAFFGHFSSTNFGNESTLQAILYHLRSLQPEAEVTCISTDPKATFATHHIKSIPVEERFFKSWAPRNGTIRALRRVCIGLPSEAYGWIKGFIRL